MRAVGHKGGEERDNVKEYICYSLDDGVRLLTLVEGVAQAGVDCDNVVNVPKDLLDEVGAAVFGDDVRRGEWGYPNLCPYQHAPNEGGVRTAYIAQVLHIAHEIALGIDDLVDRFLPIFLLIGYAVYDLFGHRMYPKLARLNVVQIAQALTAELALNTKPRLGFHVQTTLLLKSPGARDRVAQTVSGTCRRIAIRQESKYPCRQ